MKKFLLLAVLGVVFVPSASVFAQEQAPSGSVDPVARCEAMVETSKERYDANQTRNADNASRISATIEKLEAFITKANELGADTSVLSSDMQTLSTYMNELEADYQAVQDNLSVMMQSDCETMTAEEYRSQVTNAKSLFEALRANVTAIRDLRTTIKTHIDEILSTIKE
ncbi:hypothetical protein EPN81_01355 [Patescibacteria group bacterium]|nr:MAG: hypothetical protein EPN81_01355 [Patescibacteria group bacterium]